MALHSPVRVALGVAVVEHDSKLEDGADVQQCLQLPIMVMDRTAVSDGQRAPAAGAKRRRRRRRLLQSPDKRATHLTPYNGKLL